MNTEIIKCCTLKVGYSQEMFTFQPFDRGAESQNT